MLSIGATPKSTQGTMGQFSKVSVQFNSDEMLIGRNMRMNPALFIGSSVGVPNVPSNPAWQLIYPAAIGTYAMNFIAPDIYKNYYAELEVLDAYSFTIHLSFLFVTDLNGYTIAVPPLDNSDPWQSGGIYNSPRGIEFHVSDGVSEAVQFAPVSANSFCKDLVTFDTNTPNGGFKAGQALNIDITIPLSGVSSTWYCGFYRTNAISNSLAFIDDAGLSYAEINAGANNVDNIPNDCITGGTGFVTSGGQAAATVQIDKVCLEEGACYRLYCVYQQGGQWKSCLSDEICQGETVQDPIVGDFSCTVTDALGNSYAECCVSNLPSCGATTVCVTPNEGTFNSLISSAGLTGGFSDYFSNVVAFVSDAFPTTDSPGTVLRNTTDNYTGCVTYTPTGTEVKYFTFRYKMDYDTHSDFLDVVVQLGFNGSVQEPAYTATFGDGSTLTTDFCAEATGNLTITYPAESGGCTLFQSINGGELEPANVVSSSPGSIIVDPSTIAIGEEVCFVSCCVSSSSSTPCDCSSVCEDITFSLAQETCGFDSANSTGPVNVLFNVDGLSSGDIQQVQIITSSGSTLTSSTASINQTFTANFADPVSIGYDITITLVDGCVYEPSIIWLQTAGSDAGAACASNFVGSVGAIDCDCTTDPTDNCGNNIASITPSCDPSTGEINFTSSESFISPVNTDVTECSPDGITYGACSVPYSGGPELHVRRLVTFTDGCPDLLIEQLITCEQDLVCQNSSTLAHNIASGVLTLTLTPGYNSPVGVETIFVSLDGGVIFSTYIGPITLVGGESIVAYAETSFTDGCPDAVSNTITDTYEVECDYAAYSVSCDFNDTTGFFTATFVGDTSVLAVNEQLYSVDGTDPVTAYPGPVAGEVFVVKWVIALPGCPPACLVSACADCDSIEGNCFTPGNGGNGAGC